ncbi:recombinase family protein [Chitinophaga rhizosphaerae]|uniref:recombinase family protein n=1 Tax=Chitinophaga rhizosphaerae TaxID=1864947 RepID=UPI000F80DE09|nr:recombinase family protein [Chitinophaga rhizosphaerae]
MKAIGYMRLSFKDQSRYSLDAQETSIRNYCLRYNLELVALFKDNGQLSSTFNRIDFKALESYIRKNKGEVQYLVVMDHDRFSRDLSEALSKICTLEKLYGIKVVSVDEPIDIDPTNPTAFISRAFRYATANAELLNIRARTRRGIKRARLEGRFINKAPFGYRNGRDILGKGILILEANEAKIVRKIFSDYLSGISLLELTHSAQQMGFCLVGHGCIKRVLSNCIYAGLIPFRGDDGVLKYVKGIHEAIVGEQDFIIVQEKLCATRQSNLKVDREFVLKGLLKCHCGKHMTAAWSKGRTKYYLYYQCMYHRSLNVPGVVVHDRFGQILNTLRLTPQQIAYLYKETRCQVDMALNDERSQIDARKQMIVELNERIDSLEEHFIERRLDFNTFDKWSKRYRSDQKKQEEIVEDLLGNIEVQLMVVEQLFKTSSSIGDIYSLLNPLQRLLLGRYIFRHGFTWENGEQQIVYRLHYLLVASSFMKRDC